ncbi:MAG: hypothetical protein SNJ71_01245 [Bacteroidales bacterium]
MKTIVGLLMMIMFSVSFAQISKERKQVETVGPPLNGEFTSYYDNGAVKVQATFINGVVNGEYKTYYPNGQIKELRNYENGKSNGMWYLYNEKGYLLSQASFAQDQKHGTWIVFDNDGNYKAVIIYVNGKKVNSTVYDKGEIVAERNY